VRPLLESVESLCQYALSPDFAGIPAVISENGARSQIPILIATRTMLDASHELIEASRSLIANNKDPQLWQLFSSNSKIISESIKRLATSIKQKAPAKLECDNALNIIEKCMKHLEQAILAIAMNQILPLSELANSKSLQAYQEHAISCAQQMLELVDQVRSAAKGEADKLGHLVTELSQYFEPLVVNVIGCSAKTPFNNQLQTAYLEQTKTILESALQLMVASKESAGNPKNISNLHQSIDENADGTKEVLDDLIQTLEEATAQNGYVASMIDSLTKAIATLDINSIMDDDIDNVDEYTNNNEYYADENQKQVYFIEYQTKIVQLTKSIQQNARDMSICNLNELGSHAQLLTQTTNNLIVACRGAIKTCNSMDLAQRIKITTQDLAKSSIDLILLAGRVQNNCGDKMLRKDLLEQIEIVNKRVLNLLHSFQTSAKGTQACINADNSVNGIIADLNTVIMFATAGTLKSESDTDSFSNHRESVLRTAKTLVEDTKSLVSVSGAGKMIDQEVLAQGVQTSVKTITKLADAVKLGAASLGSDQPDAQVLLINSVKDVAASLSDLISAIKLASGNSGTNNNNNNEQTATMLRESAKNMVTNVQSLLKTVKTVEDEAARGTRALESAIEAIYQEVKLYSSYLNESVSNTRLDSTDTANASNNDISNVNTKPEDLIRASKQITLATSKSIGKNLII
jgi:talin